MSQAETQFSGRFDAAVPLRAGRVHEVYGSGAFGFAAILAGKAAGNVCGLRRGAATGSLTPFCDPARILTAACPSQTDALSVTEEALRSGAVPLVVTEIIKPLNLTAGRRLQLAAQAGQATGLCLIAQGMGSNAAETRWHCAPVFDPEAQADSTLMRWQITKNKLATTGVWNVRWMHRARRLDVVSASGE